eukprot:gb/GECH01013201.1/.p1 GENE.gb/GECH01013201.1/~~gb/GECH01013201.1/.p1  ORF type:complete len:128 (+),score=17.57 gb/GECH01013201.1/:1-384(+)
MSIGIPIKLIHEAVGHTVTIELISGEVYRGKLANAEDNMNCQMKEAIVTARDGRTSTLEHAFIRGSKIRFFIIPDMLKNAPMFKNIDPSKSGSRGRGMGFGVGRPRAAAMRARAAARGRAMSRGRMN